MKNASDIFSYLENKGDEALEIFRQEAFTPLTRKKLRTWGITEVAEMVGRTTQHIRQQEKLGNIPPPQNSKRGRAYSLNEINILRDHFGTRPCRQNDDEPAIIAFANFKGGAAKTTSAVNCSQHLAKKGYRVLIIDCDSQASATQIFGYNPDEHIENDQTLLPCLMEENLDLTPVIRNTYWTGLDLIPANLALYGAEFAIPAKSARAIGQGVKYPFYSILQRGLEFIKHDYDVIILDCPPSMGMISINAIYAANAFMIPIPPSMLDFASTIQFFAMLREVLGDLPNKQYAFIRLLITKHDNQDSSNYLVDTIRTLYGSFTMNNIMYTSEAIRKASGDLLTLYEIEKYQGSRATFTRALHFTDEANNEIEQLIRKTWRSTRSSAHTEAQKKHEEVGV